MKIFVSTHPFGNKFKEMLFFTGWNIKYNELGRRLVDCELINFIKDVDGIIAGTEKYGSDVIENSKNLKIISRVGAGLDNIDFLSCKKKGVMVTYTPDAPSDSVADLVIAQIINLIRGTLESNDDIRRGGWRRILGKLVSECKIGVLGTGRIGKKVIKRLHSFDADIYANDLIPDNQLKQEYNVKYVSKIDLFKICDLVTVHIPMNCSNYHLIGEAEFSAMCPGGYLINTSRGDVVDEDALVHFLKTNYLAGAAVDVFSNEPYFGPLTSVDNALLTAHLGGSANGARYLMEQGATCDCIDFLMGKKPRFIAPDIYNNV